MPRGSGFLNLHVALNGARVGSASRAEVAFFVSGARRSRSADAPPEGRNHYRLPHGLQPGPIRGIELSRREYWHQEARPRRGAGAVHEVRRPGRDGGALRRRPSGALRANRPEAGHGAGAFQQGRRSRPSARRFWRRTAGWRLAFVATFAIAMNSRCSSGIATTGPAGWTFSSPTPGRRSPRGRWPPRPTPTIRR